jgi:hypothetical protein
MCHNSVSYVYVSINFLYNWEQLKEKNKREFNYQRNLFKQIVKEYGSNLHNQIKELIKTEWELLINNCTNLPAVNTDNVYKFTECEN